jgi:hypothetical protein
MVCRSWGLFAFVLLLWLVGCVEVPDTIRAQFAGPGPQDRTNYRPGNHGAEPPPVAKAAKAATTTTTSAETDAAAPVGESEGEGDVDGGAP